MQLGFSKCHPAYHDIANGIKPGSDAKKTEPLISCILGREVIYVRCINCSYNIVTICIRLLDKKHFLFEQEKIHASKRF